MSVRPKSFEREVSFRVVGREDLVGLLADPHERGALAQLFQLGRSHVGARTAHSAENVLDGGLDGAFEEHLNGFAFCSSEMK